MSRRTPPNIPSDQDSATYLRQHLAAQAERDARPPKTGENPGFDGHADCKGRGCRECTS